MSDPIPRTEAGKSLLRWSESDGVVASAEDILAIEEQAATEARRELRNAVNDYFGWNVMALVEKEDVNIVAQPRRSLLFVPNSEQEAQP